MKNKRKKYKNKMNISGSKIRELRESKKMSREFLSNKLLLEEEIDISSQSIANIENNARNDRDYELYGLARVLKVDILILLNDYFENNDNTCLKKF